MDKKDNSLDDVINKRLLDGTIDGISDRSKDWILDGTIDGISDGSKDGISDGCFDVLFMVFQMVPKMDF